MAGNQSGSHDPHSKAGEHGHKGGDSGASKGGSHEKSAAADNKKPDPGSPPRSGSHEQHGKAGEHGHKNK